MTTFLLVHGAWHGGWCWQRVSDRLVANGHLVFAPTLTGVGERMHLNSPTISLSTHVSDVVNEIKWKDLHGIVLCGHSYGGMVISGVAERMARRIASIVFLDAFVPTDGQSLVDIAEGTDVSQPTIAPISAIEFNVNASDRAWVDGKLTPQSTACFTEKLKLAGAYQGIGKKAYVLATDPRTPFFQSTFDRLREDPSWATYELACGHDVMIDKPDELTAILEESI